MEVLAFSDIHFTKSDRTIVNNLADELADTVIASNKKIDYIFVMGDIANYGECEEYDIANIFFSILLKRLKLTNDNIYFTAGNHDVNWQHISEQEKSFKYKLYKEKDFNQIIGLKREFFNNNDNLECIYKKFENYDQFVSAYSLKQTIKNQQIPGQVSYNYSYIYKLDDCCLVSLNTAFLSGNDDSHNKEFFCIEEQLDKIKSDIGANNNIILLMHHSLYDCISQMEREEIMKYIGEQNNNIIFCGHYHKQKTEARMFDRNFINECRLGTFKSNDTDIFNFSIYSINFKESQYTTRNFFKSAKDEDSEWKAKDDEVFFLFKEEDMREVVLARKNHNKLGQEKEIDFIKFIFGDIDFQYENLPNLRVYLNNLSNNNTKQKDFVQIAIKTFEIFKDVPLINALKIFIIEAIVLNSNTQNNIAENFVNNKNIMQRVPALIYKFWENEKLSDDSKNYWIRFINNNLDKFPIISKVALISIMHKQISEVS